MLLDKELKEKNVVRDLNSKLKKRTNDLKTLQVPRWGTLSSAATKAKIAENQMQNLIL